VPNARSMNGLAATTAWTGVCALVLLAPFEGLKPIVELPGQLVTSVETAILCVFSAWFVCVVATRAMPVWRTPLTLPWVVLLAVMLVAAVAAPAHRANAQHMVGRFGVGLGVFLLTVNGVTSPPRLHGVLVVAAVAGAVISVLAVLEYLGVGPVTEWLLLFRERFTVIGPQIRAGGPFQYPTIASMYLEILFALVLALLPMTIDRGQRAMSVVVFLLLALIAEAVILTFTRAGFLTIAASLGVVGLLRYRRQRFDGGVKAIVALSVVISIELLASRPAESFVLRMTTEGQQSWYSADFEVPPEIAIPAGASVTIPVTLTNRGRTTWDPTAAAPFLVSYHWLASDGERVVEFEGVRTALPAAVAPGATIAVEARVKAPNVPGHYRLLWDIVLDRRLWFSSEQPTEERIYTSATITGSPTGSLPESRLTTVPRPIRRPGRLTLWRAGFRMVRAHPFLGVGPDNFHLVYGEYVGLPDFDTRIHTNNMYLEMLVGGGILGGLAFGWLCVRAFGAFRRAVRRAGPTMSSAAAGVAAAGVAIGLHGLVDSFLSFTGTYVLISVTLGLAVASASMDNLNANRL